MTTSVTIPKPRLVESPGRSENRILMLGEWLAPMLKRGKLAKIELSQWTSADTASPVQSWEGDDIAPEVDPNSLAGAIDTAVDRDSQNLRGTIKYIVRAWKEGAREPFAREMIKVTNDSTAELALTESPTDRGVTAMLMKHTNVAVEMTLGSFARMLDAQTKEIARLTLQNEHLIEKNFEVLRLYEELQDKKHERDLEMQQATMRDKRIGEGFETLKSLAPLVIAKAKGASLTEGAFGNTILGNFLESLSKDQVNGFLESGTLALNETQKMVIAQLYLDHGRKRGVKEESSKEEAKKDGAK